MASDGDRLRVLLADDARPLRMLIRVVLEGAGMEVVGEAEDGARAVELARELQPDVVLLDIAMPELDGLQAAPLIRQACPAAAVIMLSGFPAEMLGESASDAGADGYLEKGLRPTRIPDAIREIVREAAIG